MHKRTILNKLHTKHNKQDSLGIDVNGVETELRRHSIPTKVSMTTNASKAYVQNPYMTANHTINDQKANALKSKLIIVLSQNKKEFFIETL